MYDKITLIVNPIAGGIKNKNKVIDYISNYLSNIGQRLKVKNTTKRGDATDYALQAVQEQADLVVAVGGDGTINEVGSGLVHSDVIMGVIPLGSGNGLTRSLKIPQNVEKACELISNGLVSSMDVGRINKRYFFLVAGVGFDAVVGKKFDEYPGRGPLPYFYLSMKEYCNYSPETIQVKFNEKTLQLNPFVVVVANGPQYGNNAYIAPAAKLNDGLLDVCIIHQLPFMKLLSVIPKLFTGRLQQYSHAEFHQSIKVEIERQSPGYVNIDGEPVFEEPVIEISVMPKCLKIITPNNCPSLS